MGRRGGGAGLAADVRSGRRCHAQRGWPRAAGGGGGGWPAGCPAASLACPTAPLPTPWQRDARLAPPRCRPPRARPAAAPGLLQPQRPHGPGAALPATLRGAAPGPGGCDGRPAGPLCGDRQGEVGASWPSGRRLDPGTTQGAGCQTESLGGLRHVPGWHAGAHHAGGRCTLPRPAQQDPYMRQTPKAVLRGAANEPWRPVAHLTTGFAHGARACCTRPGRRGMAAARPAHLPAASCPATSGAHPTHPARRPPLHAPFPWAQ